METLYLLIMSTFIQIPNKINQLTKRSKLYEIITYATIRSQIKDGTYTASYPEKQLAEELNVTERSIRNYIDDLEKTGFFTITKKHGTGEYAHNVYKLQYLSNEYFAIEPEFITNQSIAPQLKGLLLLMKTHCIKGTNYLQYSSNEQLAKLLNIGKNQLPIYLKELEANGLIRFIDNTLHLPCEFFKLSITDGIPQKIYETIYHYCLNNDCIPPYKDSDTHDLGAIVAHYPDEDSLLKALEKRCPKLPKKVSFAYLTQALLNKRIETKVKPTYTITL